MADAVREVIHERHDPQGERDLHRTGRKHGHNATIGVCAEREPCEPRGEHEQAYREREARGTVQD